MSNAWRRQIFDALSWKNVRSPAVVFRCAVTDVDIEWPDRDMLNFGDTFA